MQVLNSTTDVDKFFQDLRQRSKSVLMLDYDGTLAPFKKERMEAFPYEGVIDLLDEINSSKMSRVVIVSGRAVKDFEVLLKRKTGLEIWGSHGIERLDVNGRYGLLYDGRDVLDALKKIKKRLIAVGIDAKNIEVKPASIAVHWRGFNEQSVLAIEQKSRKVFLDPDCNGKFQVKKFDGGLELRPVGWGKNRVVNRLLKEYGKDVSPVAYMGDDYTDEDAFKALKGKGLSILVREELRTTGADIWIRPPGELLEFLSNWKKAVLR